MQSGAKGRKRTEGGKENRMIKVSMNVINLYQCEPGFQTGKRIFPYHYMLYVHSGKGRYRIGTKWYESEMGDLFYCPPGLENQIAAGTDDPFLLSGIEWTSDGGFPDEIPERVNLRTCHYTSGLIQKMVEEYAFGRMYSSDLCDLMMAELLFSCMRLGRETAGLRQDVGRELLNYIRGNLARPVTHKELEQVFSYHRSSINRILLEMTGMTLKNYQIDLRIKRAAELLKYSRKTMGEIAEECGYAGPIFFSRQFKEKTGMTPSEFRKPKPEIQVTDSAV